MRLSKFPLMPAVADTRFWVGLFPRFAVISFAALTFNTYHKVEVAVPSRPFC